MDRFGDDLTEDILQYLTLEDKIRHECVSKQWQRCVFNKQFVIELDLNSNERQNLLYRLFDNRRQLNEKHLESVLKKCTNVKEVILYTPVNSSVLSLIGRYCPHMKSFSYTHSNDDKALSFFRMYGHKLEELVIIGNDKEDIEQILKFCPNVEKVSLNNNSILFTDEKEFLPKLEEIKIQLNILPENVYKMKILSDKYSQTIKTLDLKVRDLTAEELKTCFDCIARFENLTQLELEINYLKTREPIDDCLSLIGQKCNKLLKLDFICTDYKIISDRFFAVFHEFKAIKKLKIFVFHNKELSGSVECFKHCKQLIDIDISYPQLREDFFANIASFVPKLKSLHIITDKQFSDSFIESFHSMKNIQRVTLRYINEEKRYFEKFWYFGKSVSEVMLSPNGMNVKHITHNCGYLS